MRYLIYPSILIRNMGRRVTTEEFIRRSKAAHGDDTIDYSKTVYVNSKENLTFTCNKHGDFEQLPHNHINGKGCPKCVNMVVRQNRYESRGTTDEFVKKAKNIHGDRFDYSDTVYVKWDVKVPIRCKIHGIFEQLPQNHLTCKGCPKCIHDSYRLGRDEFIKRAKEVHGEDTYGYADVIYVNSQKKVKINCCKHGIFEQNPDCHTTQKQGCPDCWRDRQRSNTEEFVEKAKVVHGDLYDYSNSVYSGVMEPITIKCVEHGEFDTTPNRHLAGNSYSNRKFDGCGCPKCNEGGRLTTEIFIEKSKEVHGDLYNYDIAEYVHSLEKVDIGCSKHGVFRQTPSSHTEGRSGCPICKNSKGELKIYNLLKDRGINFEKEKRFDDCRNTSPLPFDFYLPDHNILIEYDGEQHYKSVEYWGGKEGLKLTRLRDSIKTQYCIDNTIKLIRIPYFEFDNIEEIIKGGLKLE